MTQSEKIRKLNIEFWRNPHMNGRLMLSRYVADRGPQFVRKCIEALANYDGWNPDNDPYHEADFCTLDIDGEKVFAKLDCYDKHDQNYGREDPADPAKTLRIGVVMMPKEY